jgi:hypothetical protein
MVDPETWVKSLPPFVKYYGGALFVIGVLYSVFNINIELLILDWTSVVH